MFTPDIHPIALIIIGWYFYWTRKRGITAYTIVGECLGVILWLLIHPFVRCLVVEHFADKIEMASFATYLKLNLMLMVGRLLEWRKGRRRNRD